MILEVQNFQGNAVVNYTDIESLWTRIIEHKWFKFGKDEDCNDISNIISRKFSSEWKPGEEPFYSINDDNNNHLYSLYKELANQQDKVIFAGRLVTYKHSNMDETVESALFASESLK